MMVTSVPTKHFVICIRMTVGSAAFKRTGLVRLVAALQNRCKDIGINVAAAQRRGDAPSFQDVRVFGDGGNGGGAGAFGNIVRRRIDVTHRLFDFMVVHFRDAGGFAADDLQCLRIRLSAGHTVGNPRHCRRFDALPLCKRLGVSAGMT